MRVIKALTTRLMIASWAKYPPVEVSSQWE